MLPPDRMGLLLVCVRRLLAEVSLVSLSVQRSARANTRAEVPTFPIRDITQFAIVRED